MNPSGLECKVAGPRLRQRVAGRSAKSACTRSSRCP